MTPRTRVVETRGVVGGRRFHSRQGAASTTADRPDSPRSSIAGEAIASAFPWTQGPPLAETISAPTTAEARYRGAAQARLRHAQTRVRQIEKIKTPIRR